MTKIMKVGVCSILLLCCLISGCSHKPRLDVTLEGPWVLYQYNDFDAHGKKIPVLIAIAPKGATLEQFGDNEQIHHHVPQISTGDGYYVKKQGVYCITFDGRCDLEGPGTLNHDHYPTVFPLNLKFRPPSGKTIWDVIADQGIAVILPMPNSYSNDGVWRAKFTSNFSESPAGWPKDDEAHSIGLIFHYTHGPDMFRLQRCGVIPTSDNCTDDAGIGRDTDLRNTGTLRIMMRSPDNDSVCDWHVRFAYKILIPMLGRDANKDKAYIDPARRLASLDKGDYTDSPDPNLNCLLHDPQAFHRRSSVETMSDMEEKQNKTTAEETVDTSKPLPDQIAQLIKITENGSNPGDGTLEPVLGPLKEAKRLADGLNLNFPKISQTLQIGQLLHMAAAQAEMALDERATSQKALHERASSNAAPRDRGLLAGLSTPTLLKVKTNIVKVGDDDPGTKTGGDCHAMVVSASTD